MQLTLQLTSTSHLESSRSCSVNSSHTCWISSSVPSTSSSSMMTSTVPESAATSWMSSWSTCCSDPGPPDHCQAPVHHLWWLQLSWSRQQPAWRHLGRPAAAIWPDAARLCNMEQQYFGPTDDLGKQQWHAQVVVWHAAATIILSSVICTCHVTCWPFHATATVTNAKSTWWCFTAMFSGRCCTYNFNGAVLVDSYVNSSTARWRKTLTSIRHKSWGPYSHDFTCWQQAMALSQASQRFIDFGKRQNY